MAPNDVTDSSNNYSDSWPLDNFTDTKTQSGLNWSLSALTDASTQSTLDWSLDRLESISNHSVDAWSMNNSRDVSSNSFDDWSLGNLTNVSSRTSNDWMMSLGAEIDKSITPILYIIGFPGNIISLIIWLQKRMRHSSGCYLAALALDDLIFLVLQFIFELQVTWQLPLLDHIVICEGFPILFVSSQYLSPFLVLGFTTERYISICHPFQREKYCTIKRAKIVIICMVAFMPCLNAIHGYFYYIKENGLCSVRDEVYAEGVKSLYIIYTTAVEILVFFLVPMAVLILNILVIREMKRLSKVEHVQLQGSSQRTGSTTVMLLAVSFYQILTTLPVTIVYTLLLEHDCSANKYLNCTIPEVMERHYTFQLVLSVIKEYGLTHYAFNIFIYIITGKMFRQELKKLILRPFVKLASTFPRDYSSLRSSARTSEYSRNWLSVNGNHDNDRSTDETLL